MNRRELERHLHAHARILHHHGGRHDVWVNPKNLSQAPVPRHGKIGTAQKGHAMPSALVHEMPE
jgi:mRNA interferase HicA